MSFFVNLRPPKQHTDGRPDTMTATSEPGPHKHIPIHAARDARSQVPPSTREGDREAIAKHYTRRSQMLQQDDLVSNIASNTSNEKWPVRRRDVPYVGKKNIEQPPKQHVPERPAIVLKQLNNHNVQHKTRASRRAARIDLSADVSQYLGLLSSPVTQPFPTAVNKPDLPTITLPIRKQSPLHIIQNVEAYSPELFPKDDTGAAMDEYGGSHEQKPSMTTRSIKPRKSSSIWSKSSTSSSESSQEPLSFPPRSHVRDSMALANPSAARSHSPSSSLGRRPRAAVHDLTAVEQAMALSESFRPRRAPPAPAQNDSAYHSLPMAGFSFGTERPYSPHRLRPWLVNKKNTASFNTSTVTAI